MTSVHCTQTYPYPARFVWRFLSDFFTPWHPYMAWCEKLDERTRKFGMTGEEGHYIEQMTHIDHDAYRFDYTMLEGIAAIESYHGAAWVEALENGHSQIVWTAEIGGSEKMTSRVAKGTEAVFQAGLEKLAEMMTAALEIKTEKIAGVPELAVDVAGAGELLLFLHGIGGNRTNWHAQLNSSLATRFQTAALDFRGYGESDLGDDPVTVEAQVSDLLRVLDHFGTEQAHFVGLSYGSWLAACFAHLHPERVKSLTLCAGSTGMSEASAAERSRFEALRLKPMEEGQTPAEIAPTVVEVLSGPEATVESRSALHGSMVAISRETYIAALRCFLSPPFKIDFEAFNFPTLFIAGEHDKLAAPDEMRGVAARVPNGHLAVIQGAGHLINIEKPERFNVVLEERFGESRG